MVVNARHVLHEKIYPPLRVAVAAQMFAEDGLDIAALLDGTGLDAKALSDSEARVSSLQLLTVLRNAIRQGCRSDSGLRIGLRLHVSSFGMLGYAVLCSTSLRAAFATTERYFRLGSSLHDSRWVETPESAYWVVPGFDEMVLPDLTQELYGFVRDMSVAAFVTVFKDVMGAWCVPMRVCYTGPPPPQVDMLARMLECPLEFNQPRNELHYPAAWLEHTPQLANPITAAQVSKTCSRMLEELQWQSGFTRRVYRELTCTPGYFPDIDAVAGTLCMTSRTLRRKLDAEGTCFNDLLNNVRHALAIDYLSTSMLSVDDIAAALGYSNTIGFMRAFKRWTGKSPAAFKAAMS